MNLFDMMGIEMPVETNSVNEKNTKNTKKKVTAKSDSKNISLPIKVVVQNFGTLTLTSEHFDKKSDITHDELKLYLIKTYSCINDNMNFSLDNGIFYVGYSYSNASSGNIKLPGDSVIQFGNFLLDMASVTDGNLDDGEAKTLDLANFVISSGLSLGAAADVKFLSFNNGKLLVPMPVSVSDDKIKKEIHFPVTVNFYGDYDPVTIEASENKIDDICEFIEETISKTYPEFTKHTVFCNFDKANNSIYAYINIYAKAASNNKPKELYKISDRTSLRFYATDIPVDLNELPAGEYTLKQLCKYLALRGVPECNNPDLIIAKAFKDTICFAVKFGGSKGSGVCSDLHEIRSSIKTPFSVMERQVGNTYLNIRPGWIVVMRDNEVFFKMRLPKIPKEIYENIISLFRGVAYMYNAECLARVYYNIEHQNYVLVIPPQVASISSVYPANSSYPDDEFLFNHIPILEVHSHGQEYPAFFSSVDDSDELSMNGIYGVFSFNSGIHEKETSLFRVCCGNEHVISIKPEQIFENISTNKFNSAFVSENINKVCIQ